jgi:hypothetical protein
VGLVEQLEFGSEFKIRRINFLCMGGVLMQGNIVRLVFTISYSRSRLAVMSPLVITHHWPKVSRDESCGDAQRAAQQESSKIFVPARLTQSGGLNRTIMIVRIRWPGFRK